MFSDCSSDSLNTGTFLFKKYISADDYKNLCNLILQSTITDISYLFNNCDIINYFDEFKFGSIITVNNTPRPKAIKFLLRCFSFSYPF